RLCADRDRLRQILFNLLSNAIKFTATGGQALLRIYWQDRDTVVFEVADTGIGIPEEQRSLLFQMFRQLESTYTRQYGGTGLGLALTKQLVELHGGLIKVDSEVGVGSKFTVRLPCHSSTVLEQKSPPPPRIPLPPRKGHVVLVVNREDEAILICDLLTAAGYHTVWMLDGSTALEQIKMLKPVAAIIDRQLPGMDGCELTQLLRQLPNTQSLKILLMTDPLPPEGLAYCQEQGADTCLTHPIEPEELLTSIIELLVEPLVSNSDSE
ncbi:response regulator, partial [Geitlerinema sp. P-1104]|uniref:ATP-binding protein n=1 Tax=Geitlerinema sp. P-1104 TaxID=2546230 RepID=UPI001477465D